MDSNHYSKNSLAIYMMWF